MKTLFLSFAVVALGQAGCLSVSSPRIVAGDLADAVPQFGPLDPATSLAFAPLPGTERILRAKELLLLLRQHGVTDDSLPATLEICVRRSVRSIARADIQQALWSALDVPDAELELIDFSGQPFPPGRLEFRREGLNKPPVATPDAPIIWRGKLIYDERSSVCVWAKVRVLVERQWFIAAVNIPAGAVIGSNQILTVRGRQFPESGASPLALESIAGKIAGRNIRSGERFAPGFIEDPLDVQKGDRVHVKVIEGLASLFLDAVAQSSGRKGDTVLVHNPSSGRNFRAVVQEKGEVAVRPGSAD